MDTIHNTEGCFYRALDDEPIFTLLARDPCAAEAVRWWVTLRQALIGKGDKPLEDHAMLGEALTTAQAMVEWRSDATDPAKGYSHNQPRWKVEHGVRRVMISLEEYESLKAQAMQRASRALASESGQPLGGNKMDHDEWQRVLNSPATLALGNRFLIWRMDGKLVFSENNNHATPEETKEDWTGWYPINHSLQRDMLQLAYDQFVKNQEAPWYMQGDVPFYAETLRRAIDLGTEGRPNRLLRKSLTNWKDHEKLVTFHVSTLLKALDAAGDDPVSRSEESVTTRTALNVIAERLDELTEGKVSEKADAFRQMAKDIRVQATKIYPLPFIAVDLAAKISAEIAEAIPDLDYDAGTDDFHTMADKSDKITDRMKVWAKQLADGRIVGEQLQSRRILGKTPLLGEPYTSVKQERQENEDAYKSFADDVIRGVSGAANKSFEEMSADYRKVHGIEEPPRGGPVTSINGVPTGDITDTPDMPAHSFSVFTKGRGWAYGRGLEINPSHIPDMLDRMEADGYTLVSIVGSQADKIGMMFRRIGPGFGWPGIDIPLPPVSDQMKEYTAGVPLGEISRPKAAPTDGPDVAYLGTFMDFGVYVSYAAPEAVRTRIMDILCSPDIGRGQEP